MVLSQKRAVVGRFSNYINVKHALSELQQAGFPVAQISLIATSMNCTFELQEGAIAENDRSCSGDLLKRAFSHRLHFTKDRNKTSATNAV